MSIRYNYYRKKKRKDQARGSILSSLRIKSLESTSDSSDKWNLTFKMKTNQFKESDKLSKKSANISSLKVTT